MSFARKNDRLAGRVALKQTTFNGVSYRDGVVDQPKQYHYMSDFDCFGGKLSLRAGAIKSDQTGSTYPVEGLFPFNLWHKPMQGSIQNGVLSMAFVDDVIAGRTGYFTWGDVFDRYTWADMDARTWLDVLEGR